MFYKKPINTVIEELEANVHHGLTDDEADKRIKKYGFNELEQKQKTTTLQLLLENFKDPLVIVLLAAALIQVFLGEIIESFVIFIVLVLNAILGVVQTKKAESSLESLKELAAPSAKVLRNNQKVTVLARDVVIGDIVYLEAGDYVPTDGRLLESQSLKIVEGMLTGESEPVLKHTDDITEDVPLGDQCNMVFSGSLVVYGRGTYVVSGTGMNTEVGKIAGLIETAESKQTPLQQKLEVFSKKLGIGIFILCIAIFAVLILRDLNDVPLKTLLADSFMFSIAVAVAAVPEALSSIVTIVMAVGMNTMAKKQAIIRKLPAVETLGSTSVICTDKTGTLTQNKMDVVDFYMYGVESPSLGTDDRKEELSKQEKALIYISSLNNDANIDEDGKEIGDPTEVALLSFAEKNDMDYAALQKEFKRLNELPFDSDRKIMSTVHEINGNVLMFTKGGPDVILERCVSALQDGEVVPLTDQIRSKYKEKNEEFSKRALRVLALALKDVPDEGFVPALSDEDEMILVGIVAMMDPPREEVFDAIKEAKEAGIRSIMITGDHKTTAAAIGKKIGLMEESDIAVTGQELDAMSDIELDQKLEHISVYARVSPENKIRIVNAWQKKGAVTAMTGDGVNDAPALKQANIGVSMGSGTEVAKDASSMVLVDDNFATIVNAIEVGRTVYDNIKKSITYLFAGNLGAIIAIIVAVILGWNNPFTALQLLFINLINDSLPAIALGLEKPNHSIMKEKPRALNEGLFAGGTLKQVIYRGIIIGIVVIIAQFIGMRYSTEMGVAMSFTTLIMARIFSTFTARSQSESIVKLGLFTNKYVIGAVIICFLLYNITILPFARPIFDIPTDFGWMQIGICILLALVSLVAMEVTKKIVNKRLSN